MGEVLNMGSCCCVISLGNQANVIGWLLQGKLFKLISFTFSCSESKSKECLSPLIKPGKVFRWYFLGFTTKELDIWLKNAFNSENYDTA